jgi:hypothetical protein
MKKLPLLLLLLTSGCTDATWSKVTQYGGSQHIKCYSGGVLIYEGDSTGKVVSEQGSDGYYFEDATTHEVVEISADCVFVGKNET